MPVSPRGTGLTEPVDNAIPLIVLREGQTVELPENVSKWRLQLARELKRGTVLPFPDAHGNLGGAVAVLPQRESVWDWAPLPFALPHATYRLTSYHEHDHAIACEGWALGTYNVRAERKESKTRDPAKLIWPEGVSRDEIISKVEAVFFARDLINEPANRLGPQELTDAAVALAKAANAEISILADAELEAAGYRALSSVGAGSPRGPRLIDIRWGDSAHPRLSLVGKGVCFDTGGLNIKTETGMRHMKKDMGGAAVVLALAKWIIERRLPVNLRVLIAAVENSTDGSSYRPGDVIRTRSGVTIEVGNTDAEGRVAICELLAEADAEDPELLVDVATLTLAARVALGTDIAAFFSTSDETARSFQRHGDVVDDPLWRLPLYAGYRRQIDSDVADMVNIATNNPPGAIIAALFLKEFVSHGRDWLHLDIFGWNVGSRPGRPAGGEATALRALFSYLEERFAPKARDAC